MAIKRSVAARNAAGDSFEAVITAGGAPKLKFFSGALGANCAAADPSGLLATMTMPADCFLPASNGTNSMNGTWTCLASAPGSIASYRMYANDGTTCHEQGTVTVTGGGGDLTVDNVAVIANQTVTVTQWDRTQANA